MYPLDIDKENNHLLVAGTDIGPVEDRFDLIKKMWTDDGAISPDLRKYLLPVEMDYSACPACDSKRFRILTEVNNIKLGYCLGCATPLYIVEGKVYSQITNKTGRKFVRNKLYPRVKEAPLIDPKNKLLY